MTAWGDALKNETGGTGWPACTMYIMTSAAGHGMEHPACISAVAAAAAAAACLVHTFTHTHQRLCLLHELALGPEEPLDRLHAECLEHLHASKRVRVRVRERERERGGERQIGRHIDGTSTAHRRELRTGRDTMIGEYSDWSI